MNLLQLVIKQMRQRALSTWLTLLSVMLGVGLAIAIIIFQREGEKLFSQSDYGYDLIVGAKGSKTQLVLNTVYHLDVSPGNIPYSMYSSLSANPGVRMALPMAVGDEYKGYRVVAAGANIFPIDHEKRPIEPASKVFEYRLGRTFEFAEGRPFHPQKFEAVVGSDVAEKGGLKIGSTFSPQHGAADGRGEQHQEKWTIVGVLKPTQTAKDRVIFTPLLSFYAIGEHEKGLREMAQLEQKQNGQAATKPATKPAAGQSLLVDDPDHADDEEHGEHEHAYTLKPDGTIDLHLPQEDWKLSAIFLRTRGGFWNATLNWQINNQPYAMAVIPAAVMREFFDTFLKGSSKMLFYVSLLVTIVASVSILVSIYNAVSARLKEIAILRALGATRTRVLVLICAEAGLVGLAGGLIGFVLGHLLAAGGSIYLERLMGQGIAWVASGPTEWLYLVIVVCLAVLAGLVPAMKAYRTSVADNLVSG